MRKTTENMERKSHGPYKEKTSFDSIDKIKTSQRNLSQKSIKFFEDEKYHKY